MPIPRPSTFIHFTQRRATSLASNPLDASSDSPSNSAIGIVIVGGVLGWWREIDDAIREGFAYPVRRAHVLGRYAQLIACDKAQQRAPGARDELWVSPVHWATN